MADPALSFRYDVDPIGSCSCGNWERRGGSPTWIFIEWWKHVTAKHQDEPNVLKPYKE